MMNLPAASAAPAPSAAANAAKSANAANAVNNGLPPPAANSAGSAKAADAGQPAPAAKPADTSAADGSADSRVAAALGAAAKFVPGPFGAILDALADAAHTDGDAGAGKASEKDAGTDDHAAAAAVATMLPAMGALPLPGAPGATPASVAAVAAALTGAANAPAAGDSLLRQQAQANVMAARATAETAQAPTATLLDARAAMLATAARPLPAAAQQAPAPAQPGDARPSASAALSAALSALQGGQAADSSAAPIAAKDSASLLADSQRQPGDGNALPGFRSVLAGTAPGQPSDAVHLSGSPEQWQQPLRAALGDRLQLQLARNDDRAVIRLEPPNMGSVEISVRHTGGALQVNIAASHSEVLRQLNTIGDAVRQDLSQRQLGEVAVTVTASNARSMADGGHQQRQQEAHQQREQQRQPGRALDDGDAGTTTFAMLGERE
jgi:flagellar hook-length control protein FliK